jgi:hypothetical protein
LIRGGKDLRACATFHCERCGWSPDVAAARLKYLRRYGLRTGKDGLKYIPARPGKE